MAFSANSFLPVAFAHKAPFYSDLISDILIKLFSVQGDHGGFALPFVDIITIISSQHNFQFDVNKRQCKTTMATLYV